jgi:hypothetical protein
MSVEFQLDHQDHPKVEDFLARDSRGIGAITLHPKAAAHQQAAAEAAIAAGVEVLYDPRTERLEHDGFTINGLPGFNGTPYDVNVLAANLDARQALVEQIIAAHPAITTIVTPPHFYVADARGANLNLALAEATKLMTEKKVRPVFLVRARFSSDLLKQIAKEYVAAGFNEIDLRISPLGGENDGIAKIRSTFAIADIFRSAGLRVVLGRSGNVGQAAFALGHVDAYSVGLGQMEHTNHAADISRQKRPPKLDENGKKTGGVWQGVYLPGIAATVSMKRARQLLGHSDVRSRLGCRIDACANSLLGPINDHRSHYLHARANDMGKLLDTPVAWRAKLETDRLQRAVELRELVNESYRSKGEPLLQTRTLHSLLDGIEQERISAVA